MRVALHIIAANRGTDKAYHTIKERIQSYNQLIVVDIFKELTFLANQLKNNGSVYNKVILVSLIGEDNLPDSFYDDIMDSITIISQNLSDNQTVTLIEKKGSVSKLLDYSSEICLHLDNFDYKQIEKQTPGDVVSAVFGAKKINVSKEVETMRKVVKQQKDEEDVVVTLTDDDDESVEVEDDASNSTKRHSGIFGGFFGSRNKKSKITEDSDEPVAVVDDDADNDEPVDVVEDGNDEPVAVLIDDDEPVAVADENYYTNDISDKVKAVKNKPTIRKPLFNKKKVASNPISDDIVTPEILKHDKSDTPEILKHDKSDTPEVESYIDTEDSNCYNDFKSDEYCGSVNTEMPVFKPPVNDSIDDLFEDEEEPSIPTPEVTVTPSGKEKKGIKGIFGNNRDNVRMARKSEKKFNKEQLSMVRRPKIIAITGGGRIGVSTLAASLGFVGAERMCNTLIVDLDFIKRTQSCIYMNIENDYSASIQSGIAGAVESPHLTQQYAYETHTRLSHLGIDITCEYNRKYLDEISTEKLKNMFTSFFTMYNLIVVDIPWNYLVSHAELAYVFNSIIYVSSNDMITIVNDANLLDPNAFKNVSDFSHIMNKMSFVLNMTSPENVNNNKKISKKNFSDIMFNMTQQDDFVDMPVLVEIPLISNIGNQASYRQPAAAYSDMMHSYCTSILYSLSDRN